MLFSQSCINIFSFLRRVEYLVEMGEDLDIKAIISTSSIKQSHIYQKLLNLRLGKCWEGVGEVGEGVISISVRL